MTGYTSERFIHDELIRRAANGLEAITKSWSRDGMIHPFMLSWPAEEVHTDNGQPIEDTVAMQLPLDKAEWAAAMKSIVTRTKPYALLLCEQREHEVVVIFESQHGTKSWHFPILKLGNRFLGYRTEKEDTESIGILWRSTKALA